MNFTRGSAIGKGFNCGSNDASAEAESSLGELLELAITTPGESGSVSIASIASVMTAASWATVKGTMAPNKNSVTERERVITVALGVRNRNIRAVVKRDTSWTSGLANT